MYKKFVIFKNKIVKKYRMKKLFNKYKNNYFKNKVLYLNSKYHQCGLTTLVIIDSLIRGIPIYVPTLRDKFIILNMMYSISTSNKCYLQFTKNNVLTRDDIGKMNGAYIPYILIDNKCTYLDLVYLRKKFPNTIILNGAIYYK